YERTLGHAPNRFNSLIGTGRLRKHWATCLGRVHRMLACSALLPRLPIGLNWRRCGPSCAEGRRQIARCSHSCSHRTLGIEKRLEAPPGFEPGVEVLQTSALPLGDGAPWGDLSVPQKR